MEIKSTNILNLPPHKNDGLPSLIVVKPAINESSYTEEMLALEAARVALIKSLITR